MMYLKHRCNTLDEILAAERSSSYEGVEFDVVWGRGGSGRVLVLNHEHGGTGPQLEEVLACVPRDFVLAVNVKEYGMAESLKRLLAGRSEYFVFDVPGPELDAYAASGVRYFGRRSEYELQTSPHGAIVDSFSSDTNWVLGALREGDALISPTLRGLPQWPEEVLAKTTYLITK